MEDTSRADKVDINCERDDFIVITEFSEREGPISPLTIPMELPSSWNFNKSKFALRVLGSEFRKKKALGTLPSINVCDMQQFFEDDFNSLYIYCHYLSIADFGARGYMRALCLTYITPTPKKIQRIFSWLKERFNETALILKRSAQKTFLIEIDEIISEIASKNVNHNEYNDLFQCHLDFENHKNILIDMNEIRQLFGQKLLDKPQPTSINNEYLNEYYLINRTRHRPHRVGKEGYKPLKQLIERNDYNKFRDSLRNIHSQFGKNCLDIYVDHLNKELQHLNPNKLFAIGSLSCLDIQPCHYLSPSWKQHDHQQHDDGMTYLQNNIINNNNNNTSKSVSISSPTLRPMSPTSIYHNNTSRIKSPPIHPNLFLNKKGGDNDDNNNNDINITTKQQSVTINKKQKKRSSKITPSQHLSGRNYNNNKKFLKLYDKKMKRIARKNSKIMIQTNSNNNNNNNHNMDDHKQQQQTQETPEIEVKQNTNHSLNDGEKEEEEEEEEEEGGGNNNNNEELINNIWENFIMSRNKCDLEVHKETKKTRNDSKQQQQHQQQQQQQQQQDINKINIDNTESNIDLTTPKLRRKRSVSTDNNKDNNNKDDNNKNINDVLVRFRECSDRAREKNLSRCLLGRFRGFAESILFTILTNRTLVILANDVKTNKEKVQKTVRALSLLIPGVENTNSTQEWRDEPLFCHQLPKLKIVGMSSKTCDKSPDNIWDLITIIQFDDSILYGPRYKCDDENKSFIHRMLHPRKRFKTPNLFYRYLSRILLEMSLHCFLFYYISQTTINIQITTTNGDNKYDPNSYYMALLETLQFTQSSDIDIAKHWSHIMQKQLYSLCKPIKSHSIHNQKNQKNEKNKNNDIRTKLLEKYGRREPPTLRIT